MKESRRDFLKVASVAGAGAVAAGCAATGSASDGAPKRVASGPMPRGMTLVSMMGDGGASLGVKTAGGILDVKRAAASMGSACATTTDDLIRYGDGGLSDLVRSAGSRSEFLVQESAVRFAPVVANPEKIVCVGLNYARHARETNNPIPKLPILFNKFNNTLNAHNGTVNVSKITEGKNFDYESELVIVMGRTCSNVSEADATKYVFGYCNGNDFTARDLQSRSSQWMIGKTCDGFGLLGPWLLTADLVDQNNLPIVGTVNGEVRQKSNTNDMVFNCAQIIAYTSKLLTLQPGDLIYTGTPEGVISGYPKEKQVWLKPGDKLTTTIGNLGTLSFTLT